MAERIKLENPGDELTMTPTTVSVETIGDGSYYKFSDGIKELLVPVKGADRQFPRIGVTNILETIGKGIRFSRSKELSNYGKPFWNLDKASAATAPSGKQPHSHSNTPNASLPDYLRDEDATQTAALHAKVNGTKESDTDLYKRITQFVLSDIAPMYESAQIGLSPEAAAACAATLFIQAKKAA